MPTYINRVYDPTAVAFVRWSTATVDSAGASYPGPDAFGNTFDYCLETIIPTGSGVVPGAPTEVLETDQLTNDAGVTVFQGHAVQSDGDLTFILANPDGFSFVGFVNEASILNGSSGEIAVAGVVTIPAARQEGVWVAGDNIYLSSSTAGDMQTAVPVVPSEEFDCLVGLCLNTPVGGDAKILIRKERSLELLPEIFV